MARKKNYITSESYTKCKFNNKIVYATICSKGLVDYYYDDNKTKHYKVQTLFFSRNAKVVK